MNPQKELEETARQIQIEAEINHAKAIKEEERKLLIDLGVMQGLWKNLSLKHGNMQYDHEFSNILTRGIVETMEKLPKDPLVEEIDTMIEFIEEIRSIKSNTNCPNQVDIYVIPNDPDDIHNPEGFGITGMIHRNEKRISHMAKISSIETIENENNLPSDSHLKNIPSHPMKNCRMFMVLEEDENLDTEKEIQKLELKLEKIQKELKSLNARLDNPKFRNKAPSEIVQQSLEKQSELLLREEQITKTLESLEKREQR